MGRSLASHNNEEDIEEVTPYTLLIKDDPAHEYGTNTQLTTSASTTGSDINGIKETDEVLLMDISWGKNWICHVYNRKDAVKTVTHITRCRFKAKNKQTNKIEDVAAKSANSNEHTAVSFNPELSNLDITDKYSSFKEHTKFLSISPDGKYIALSCYGREKDGQDYLEEGKARCFIFEVTEDKIVPHTELKNCNGRAVFLERRRGKLCLAIINEETLKIYYSSFEKISKHPTDLYDLTPLSTTTINLRENTAHHESYIKDSNSWVKMATPGGSDNIKKIITFSRHIRNEVLVTPYDSGGIVRVWSIKDDGVRLTSFCAPDEHIMAFSKDLKYAATVTDGIRAVKIYNVKNGLLVYTLNSQFKNEENLLEVTHIRFCYDSRYLALSGMQKNEVVFEVWYIEAEKSIYGSKHKAGEGYGNKTETVKPFVYKSMTSDNKKCLKGVYTYTRSRKNEVLCLELPIDKEYDITWLPAVNAPCKVKNYEIENSLACYDYLKCTNITVEGKTYHVRFGNSMIQLWLNNNLSASSGDTENQQLVYIRAYKGPKYGLVYSFRDCWEIKDFNSIKFVAGPHGTLTGRLIVNIKQSEASLTDDERTNLKGAYHTEEIFLPVNKDQECKGKFDYHTFESACQALHYLHLYWKQEFNTKNISQENVNEDAIAEIKFNAALRSLTYKDQRKKRLEFERKKSLKQSLSKLFTKTDELIRRAVDESTYENSNYFATMAGSRTLSMLASFDQGREIIKRLLRNEDSISFSIFSYPSSIREEETETTSEYADFEMETRAKVVRTVEQNCSSDGISYRSSPKITEVVKGKFSSIAKNENVLTVLIKELSYNLYKLMFNRILSDSKNIGPGCLSALADALLYLQEEGNTDLLLTSSQKLSYLAIDKLTLGILESEMGEVLKMKDLRKEYVSNIRNLECHSTIEQIQKYRLKWDIFSYYIAYKWRMLIMRNSKSGSTIDSLKITWRRTKYFFLRFFGVSQRQGPKNKTQICVVPLPYFNTYNILLEDRFHNSTETTQVLGCITKKKHGKTYKSRSAFIAIASGQDSNNIFRQGDTVLEVMLQYKWREFLRIRFVGICLIHAAYYISYCTGVLFAFEMYGYDSADEERSIHGKHLASIIIAFISGSVLLGQEINQIIKSKRVFDYLRSGYNWVDLAAFVFPLVTFFQLILNMDKFYEICSMATLVLWLHGILRLRVISFVGIALETIIQLVQKVGSILFILLLVIFAFTQSFMVLLRRRDDEFFQENHNGTTSMYSSNAPAEGAEPTTVGITNLFDISSSNGFTDPYKAFYQVWLIVFGVWDPVTNGDAGDDKMVFFLCILFALITVLIFTNMVIALMSSTVDEVKKKGNKVWVSHFAAVVAEVEQLWCFPSTKHKRINNPNYIYYIANYDAVQRQEEQLEKETKELRKKVLGIDGSSTNASIACKEISSETHQGSITSSDQESTA